MKPRKTLVLGAQATTNTLALGVSLSCRDGAGTSKPLITQSITCGTDNLPTHLSPRLTSTELELLVGGDRLEDVELGGVVRGFAGRVEADYGGHQHERYQEHIGHGELQDATIFRKYTY